MLVHKAEFATLRSELQLLEKVRRMACMPACQACHGSRSTRSPVPCMCAAPGVYGLHGL